MKPDQERVRTLLTETITLLCKNGLHFKKQLRVQGLLGVTLDDDEVFIVHLNETLEEKSAACRTSEESVQNTHEASVSRESAILNGSPSRRIRKRRQFQSKSAISSAEVESEASLTTEDVAGSSKLEISHPESTAEVGKHSSDSCHSYDTTSSVPVKQEPTDDDLIVVEKTIPPKRRFCGKGPSLRQNPQEEVAATTTCDPACASELKSQRVSISTKTELPEDDQEFDALGSLKFVMPNETPVQPLYNVAMSENLWTESQRLSDPANSVQRFSATNILDVSWASMQPQDRTDCFPAPGAGDPEDSTSFPDGTSATRSAQSTELWRYMRRPVDSAEKEYRCEYTGCGKSYYERKNLLQHQYLKHGRARVPRQW